MNRFGFVFAILLLTAPGVLHAATYDIDPVHSHVGFKVGHLVGFVPGSFTDFSGTVEFDEKKPASAAVSVKVAVKSLDTNQDARDEHLLNKDFFDAGTFPEATFKSKKVIVGEGPTAKVVGDLTLLGKTREITLHVTYNGTGRDHMGNTRIGFSAEATIDRTDFGMTFNIPAKSGGMMLANEVTLVFEIEAMLRKSK